MFDEKEHGLTEEVLANTDVLVFWTHMLQEEFSDDVAERVRRHVLAGMGLVVLHSGHYSKIMRKLLGTSMTLRWRHGDRERLFCTCPTHPIAQGIPAWVDIPEEEMYGEFFDIPKPDDVVFTGWFAGGEVFRSGCTFTRGLGKIFFGLVQRPVEAFNFYAGDGFDLAVERALKDAGDAELNYLQEGIRLGRAWFNEDPLYHVKPYPNMRETLTALREEVPIAVCSNKPHEAAIHVVESVYGPGFFNRIQGQTAEIPRKPSPIGALAIADALGARPEECLYFGDTNTDMQTGNAAGMFTVGVTWGFRPRQELIDNHAMELLDRPEEILTLFHRKNQEK